jgi:hypothetical protein
LENKEEESKKEEEKAEEEEDFSNRAGEQFSSLTCNPQHLKRKEKNKQARS